MRDENLGRAPTQIGMSSFRKGVIAVLALLLAFLTGFLPSYSRTKNLESELRAAREENNLGQLRDLASLTYTQAAQHDYGLAAGTSTQFFNRTRETMGVTANPVQRQALEHVLSLRDPLTVKLGKADPSVVKDLQSLLLKTREATTLSRIASP